ncbi:MAG: hypothetical protein GC136_08500 [Alphaproteobacteria bacterium]|nr:hypothetical protein [Alphaproteobacteria bacterium]
MRLSGTGKSLGLSIIFAASALTGPSAIAQVAPTAPSTSYEENMDEQIVVTAPQCYSPTTDNRAGPHAGLVNEAVQILNSTRAGRYLYQQGYINYPEGRAETPLRICMLESLNDSLDGAHYDFESNIFYTRTNVTPARLASSLGHELSHREQESNGAVTEITSLTPDDGVFTVVTMEASAGAIQAALDAELMQQGHRLYTAEQLADPHSDIVQVRNLQTFYEAAGNNVFGIRSDSDIVNGMAAVFDRMVYDNSLRHRSRDRVVRSFCSLISDMGIWSEREINRGDFLRDVVGGSPYSNRSFVPAGRFQRLDILTTYGAENRICRYGGMMAD